jgi:hypothetical protein
MLVTRKINVFSFFLGKPQAESSVKAVTASKARTVKENNFDEVDKRISITKSEDLYKAHSASMINSFSQLNR